MNIFATSECPKKTAMFLDDKRVVKMCLETAQLLSTAVNLSGGRSTYKTTHANHPCSVWTRQSKGNYAWLLRHFYFLCKEYEKRYNREHKCFNLLPELSHGIRYIQKGDKTPFPNCAANQEHGLDFKNLEDTTVAYQLYLSHRWETDKRVPTWYGSER